MNKLYNKIVFHNDTSPDLNEDNLNEMSEALDGVDSRIVQLAGDVIEKAHDIMELSENPPYIGDNGNWWTWDTNTGAYVDSGTDASISVEIADATALEPDATPYVTNTGTNTDPVFHLFIPKGQPGEPGTTTYSELTDKPSINSIALNGAREGIAYGLVDGRVEGLHVVAGSTATTDMKKGEFVYNLQEIIDPIFRLTADVSSGQSWTASAVSVHSISDDTDTRIDAKYAKPSGGIPKTDLASDVQTSLGKADTALQSFTETDPTVPSWAKASSKPTYTASEVGALSSSTTHLSGDIATSEKGANNGVATLDANGKLTSSQLPSDVIKTSNTAGLVKNDGTIDTNSYITSSSISGKADKVSSAINGNFAGLDSNGNLTDSGKKPSDFLTSHQDISGKADKVTNATNGNLAGLNSNGNITDSGLSASNVVVKSNTSGLLKNDGTVDTNSYATTGKAYSTDDTAETTLADDDYVPFFDTSATGKRKTLWSNIKAKLKTYFDTLYTNNTGTVTSVGTGVGLTGGSITTSGTVKAKLRSETALTRDSAAATETENRIYPVVPDKSGYLAVNVPWTAGSASDDKVSQTNTTTSSDYRVLFSNSANDTTETAGARKSTNLKFNPSTGNLQATQLNGVTIGSSPKFTDTTYSSQAASSGGTTESLCTTGEKYTWNNKMNNDGSNAATTVTFAGQVQEGSGSATGTKAHAEGESTTATGTDSHAEGKGTSASGNYSHAEGSYSVAIGDYSHAEGSNCYAMTAGSHAEGSSCYAMTNNAAHAEGVSSYATGSAAHAEGYNTTASGEGSHSEGYMTKASGKGSHSEGISTTASGNASHAGGHSITTADTAQFIHGYYNSSVYKFRSSSMDNLAGSAFGFGMNNMEYSTDTTLANTLANKSGVMGCVYDTATVTIPLEVYGMYLLFCSSYTQSTGAIYGATTRMITAHEDTGSPTNLSLGQTSNAPATITMLSGNKISIKNGAATRATQFQLMRVL